MLRQPGSQMPLFLTWLLIWIWAASWQNQRNGMCAQRRLRSAWASAQSDQSLRCALNGHLRTQAFFMRIAKTQIRLGGYLSLRWAHMPFCWFCHDAAHLYFDTAPLNLQCRLNLIHLLKKANVLMGCFWRHGLGHFWLLLNLNSINHFKVVKSLRMTKTKHLSIVKLN